MKTLIVYTSIEGQTRKIAGAIAGHIESAGGQALLLNAGEPVDFAIEKPEAAILCAPIHVGHYPSPFVDFVHREAAWLNSVPSAFISVTLAIRSDDAEERAEAERFPDALLAETGWKPRVIHHAAGALRYTEYDFFKRWMLKRIAAKEGGSTDTGKDTEYTDWASLEAFVDAFLKLATNSARA